jgi:hypothetical protein
MPDIKRLFWDLETSPNVMFSWRAGYKINLSHDNIIQERAIICVCYKWEEEDDVHCIEWKKGNDKQLVKQFSKIILEADEIVAHNGNKFDLKWFNTRNLIHNLPPIPQYKTVDTLTIARKHFYLNSNRLDYLGKILLNEGKIDVPYDLWKRICLHHEPSAMEEMVRYCKKDVELLERVWKKLSAYDAPKSHTGVLRGLERWTCPHCGSENVKVSKTIVTSKGITQKQMKCGSCHRYYSIAQKVWRDYLVAKTKEE